MSDHVRRIRRLVGSELLILPSVSVLVRDDENRVLLVRHADSGRWGLIGGAVEVDERPEAAAIRETQEEAGVLVDLTGLVTVLGGPEFRVTYPNGDRAAYVSAVYEARVSGGYGTTRRRRDHRGGLVQAGGSSRRRPRSAGQGHLRRAGLAATATAWTIGAMMVVSASLPAPAQSSPPLTASPWRRFLLDTEPLHVEVESLVSLGTVDSHIPRADR